MKEENQEAQDSLESFVANNSAKFDTAKLPDGLWKSIEAKLPTPQGTLLTHQKQPKTWRYYLSIAASIVVLLSVGAFGGIYYSQHSKLSETIAQQVDPEYLETEQYYVGKVNSKVKQLASVKNDPDINVDLAQIDQFITDLKTELINAPKSSREQIVKNLIANYQIKLDLLDKVLRQLPSSTIHQKENQNHEKVEL